MEKIFDEQGEYAAMHAAEKWLETNGFSVGPMQRDAPRLIAKGEAVPNKYRNYDDDEIEAFDGVMIGNYRNGPVKVRLKQEI